MGLQPHPLSCPDLGQPDSEQWGLANACGKQTLTPKDGQPHMEV